MRNFISTPNIRLKRLIAKYFLTYNLDEYKTSKLKSGIFEECENLSLPDKFGVDRELHSVLTYNREIYQTIHKGPKSDFNYRLSTLERAGEAGFREIGIGILIGLSDFRTDMFCLALHAEYLFNKFWKSGISVSFPRLRSAAGGFKPSVTVSDKELAQAVFALRMVMPDADLVLSTRENPEFRDGMAGIGITRMSAGSKTNPGGYTISNNSLEQFEIADERTPEIIASMLKGKNLDPV